jgi:hypothetical protein
MAEFKAKMNFYHDQVGSKEAGECFEVADAKLVKELENAGYVEKSDMKSADMGSMKSQQQAMAQKQAEANMAVHKQSNQYQAESRQANMHQANVTSQSKAKVVDSNDSK